MQQYLTILKLTVAIGGPPQGVITQLGRKPEIKSDSDNRKDHSILCSFGRETLSQGPRLEETKKHTDHPVVFRIGSATQKIGE